MFRELFNRAPRSSGKSQDGVRRSVARPVLERLEDRQLMSGTVAIDYAAGFTGDFYCGTLIKGHNGNAYAYGNGHKLTGAI